MDAHVSLCYSPPPPQISTGFMLIYNYPRILNVTFAQGIPTFYSQLSHLKLRLPVIVHPEMLCSAGHHEGKALS